MGHCQFIPTSFLRYGVDGDGDNRVDIWTNLDDVFSSIANYLATEGWQQGLSWGQEILLPAKFELAWSGTQQKQGRQVGEWRALGVTAMPGSPLPPPEQQVWIIVPDNLSRRAFMVSSNFRVLTHWNRSYYFAISVGMMVDEMMKE